VPMPVGAVPVIALSHGVRLIGNPLTDVSAIVVKRVDYAGRAST